MRTLAANNESAVREVRALSEGHQTRAAEPRRLTTYQLTRAGRALRYVVEVRNALALPLGWRVIFNRR